MAMKPTPADEALGQKYLADLKRWVNTAPETPAEIALAMYPDNTEPGRFTIRFAHGKEPEPRAFIAVVLRCDSEQQAARVEKLVEQGYFRRLTMG